MEYFWTVAEVARLLKLTRKNVYGLIRQKRLNALKIGRLWRVSRGEIEAFLEEAHRYEQQGVRREVARGE